MYYHSRRTHKLYEKRRIATTCPFCDPAEIDYRLIEQTEHSFVIPNQTPYEIWESHRVLDHLMVIPKRHVQTLGELHDDELVDIMRLTASYEAKGYSIYARAPDNTRRSVQHQHTHLIRISPKPLRFLLLIRKPYHLIKF